MHITNQIKLSTILLILLCIPFFGSAQNMKFQHIDAKDGLSQSVVKCIFQDSKGFMWFGTDDGLNRYNGIEMTVFKSDIDDSTSISSNAILSIGETTDGKILIGTNGGGLNVYDYPTNSFTVFQNKENNPNSISNNKVYSLLTDNKGAIWVGTDVGLNLFEPSTGNFTRITNSENEMIGQQVYALEEGDDHIWIGTYDAGLYSYNKDSKELLRHVDVDESHNLVEQNSDHILSLLYYDSKIWVGTQAGPVYSYNPSNSEYKYYLTESNIAHKFQALSLGRNDNEIWVGSQIALTILNTEISSSTTIYQNEYSPTSLSSNSIRSLFKDAAGSIWVGTEGGGLSVYHQASNKFTHYTKEIGKANTLNNEIVLAISEDNEGNIWIGTNGGGINILNPKTGIYSYYPTRDENNTHERILCFLNTKDKMWFGTWGGGFNYFDYSTQEFGTPVDNNTYQEMKSATVLSIKIDNKGYIWAATLNGLIKYNPEKKIVEKIYNEQNGLSTSTIMCLEVIDNIVCIGTLNGGINILNGDDITILQHNSNQNNSLPNNNSSSIYIENDTVVWFGTENGLSKYNLLSKTYRNFHDEDGLPSNYIYGILEDEQHNIWVSTGGGLAKVSFKNDQAVDISSYSSLDGLQSNEFNQGAYHKANDGKLYFGGINGFNAFYPDDIKLNDYSPPVYITNFKLFGKDIPLDSNIINKNFIELSYKDNFFSFEFAGLNYVLPKNNLYSYKMVGFDENWSPPTKRNYANYTNLPGGNYTFMVKSANNDGIWSSNTVGINIRIIPPFYKTNWFYALCVLTSLASIFLFIRVRTQKIKREKKVLEVEVTKRTQELEQKNKDILDSIHYAQRIQQSILPQDNMIKKNFPKSFVYYQPKDIVSGDFYWFTKKNKKKIIAAVDCTGHGVPGAFMSMIGNNLLNQIVIENGITEPDKILTELSTGVVKALKQNTAANDNKDGMDLALCVIDEANTQVQFAGAYRPLYFMRNGNIEKIDGSKAVIGVSSMGQTQTFETVTRELKEGDAIYIFSDGYPDQFGGEYGKKFMTKRLQQLLVESKDLTMEEQKIALENNLVNWMGSEEQIDDILVVGIKF